MNKQRRGMGLALASVAMIMGAVLVGNLGGVANGETSGQRLERQMERVRHVSGAYHNEALAIAGGFERKDVCVASQVASYVPRAQHLHAYEMRGRNLESR